MQSVKIFEVICPNKFSDTHQPTLWRFLYTPTSYFFAWGRINSIHPLLYCNWSTVHSTESKYFQNVLGWVSMWDVYCTLKWLSKIRNSKSNLPFYTYYGDRWIPGYKDLTKHFAKQDKRSVYYWSLANTSKHHLHGIKQFSKIQNMSSYRGNSRIFFISKISATGKHQVQCSTIILVVMYTLNHF